MDLDEMNVALASLCDKYSVIERGTLQSVSGEHTGGEVQLCTQHGEVSLFPWRVIRRFQELKTLAAGPTLEGVSTLRFMYASERVSMSSLLYREFDLCEWIGNAPIKSVFMTECQQVAANVIIRLANGVSCSVECSRCLPMGAEPLDRHEIIARRGVASDRVVDTQVPQSSIYVFNHDGNEKFTDEDAELFGMEMDSAFFVRAAFAVLKNPTLAQEWNNQHSRLLRLIGAAEKSAADCKLQTMEVCA